MFENNKLPESRDKIVSIDDGTYGRSVSPPTRPQVSVTTSSLLLAYSL